MLRFVFWCAAAAAAAASSQPPPCCAGAANVLDPTTKTCSDGAAVRLGCTSWYRRSVNDSDEDVYHAEGGLSFFGQIIDDSQSQYCETVADGTTERFYIICMEENPIDTVKMKVNAILGYISVLFIILTVIVYVKVPSLLDLQGKCMVHSLLGLGVGYFSLGIHHWWATSSDAQCMILAYIPYISLMYSFFWLNILSFHLWRTIVNPKSLRFTNKWPLIYHIIGISGPIICFLIVLLAEFSELSFFDNAKPEIGVTSCWFRALRETFIYFYGPISALLLINLIYYVWTVIVLWGQMKNCRIEHANKLKNRLLLCLKLFFIMGITWIFEVLSAGLEPYEHKIPGFQIMWILTDALNALQGLLIFLILVVFRKKVRRNLANKKICYIRFPAKWRTLQDEESCVIQEEELNLSTVATNGVTKI